MNPRPVGREGFARRVLTSTVSDPSDSTDSAGAADSSGTAESTDPTRPTDFGEYVDGNEADDSTTQNPYDHLRTTDLASLVDEYGELSLSTRGGLFERLVVSIVRQLISTAQADRIVADLRERYEITPSAMLEADEADLRELGLSGQKVGYIRNAAEWWQEHEPSRETLAEMSDDAVVDYLTEISGVGDWTANMVLMLGLERPDVFPLGDYALRKGVRLLVGDGEELTKAEIREAAEPWRPFRSYATMYVWWWYVDEELEIDPDELVL